MDVDKMINNIIGKKKFGGKNDLDYDGVPNRKDCQPRNTMRQDASNFKIGDIIRFGNQDNNEIQSGRIINIYTNTPNYLYEVIGLDGFSKNKRVRIYTPFVLGRKHLY